MITIINSSRELTPVEQYLMTMDSAIKSMKDVPDGTSIKVSAYLTFEDKKDNGDTSEILSILTPDNEVFSCQSATFKRSLLDMVTIMGGKEFAIIKTSGTTKAGRPYINCSLDVASVK